jgi:hypothetical protein
LESTFLLTSQLWSRKIIFNSEDSAPKSIISGKWLELASQLNLSAVEQEDNILLGGFGSKIDYLR